jgi:hypothetical protein
MLKNRFRMGELKVFVKILKFLDVVHVIASWKELIVIFPQTDNIFDVPGQSKFRGYRFVFAKVVNNLSIEKVDIIDVFLFTQILEIIN